MMKQDLLLHPVVLWLRFILRMALFALMLFWPAGTWDWWEAWVVLAMWFVFGLWLNAYLLYRDPELLSERLNLLPLQKDQKSWDKLLVSMFILAWLALYIVPGLDVVRYGWSESLPLWLKIIAMIVHVPCFVLLGWVMHENTYLSQVVKIDQQRDHHVITTGPYALVRHPMYTVVIVLLYATPLALGSRYALPLAVYITVLIIIRTWLEDRTLHQELPGYTEYARQTRYRLVPGVW